MELYHQTSFRISREVTKSYSTSFYLATRLLERDVQSAIHGVYGFVRYADEIVDTFHNYNKADLLDHFEADLKKAIAEGISLNPILHTFQLVVNQYAIPYELIDNFLRSMRMDLNKNIYFSDEETASYIYGSANVVGLMCLKIFCYKNPGEYEHLRKPAEMLGSAFQKVNFLRDLKADTEELNRSYFTNINSAHITEAEKTKLIADIEKEFDIAFEGIKELPGNSKLAVLAAYYYYKALLKRIKNCNELTQRVSVPNTVKLFLTLKAIYHFNVNKV